MNTADYVRIVVVNAIIVASWALVMVHMWPPVHWLLYWVGIIQVAVFAFVLWSS